jgi:hypothetical protein
VIELAEGKVLPCDIIASFDECLLGTRDRMVLHGKELCKQILIFIKKADCSECKV